MPRSAPAAASRGLRHLALKTRSLAATKRFYVEWDKNGTCIDVATYNYSYNR